MTVVMDKGSKPQAQPEERERFVMFGTRFEGSRIVHHPAMDDAKQHLGRSWSIALAATLIVTVFLLWNQTPVFIAFVLAGLAAYVAWASYWGIVGFGGWTTNFIANYVKPEKPPFMEELLWNLATDGVLVIPLFTATIGILYGVVGGGILVWLKHRRIVANSLRPSE